MSAAAPSIPVLDAAGRKSGDLSVEPEIFAAEVRRHLVHETVRAEAAAARAGTRAAKSRGLVSGGRSKPWRQKGTGRARAGTTRAPQWRGGGVAHPPMPRSFEIKVNRKVRKAALRGALSHHAEQATLAVIDGSAFDAPSTKAAAQLVKTWGAALPLLVVCTPTETALAKSFRNLDRLLVVEPSELEVGALVWARSVLVTQSALERLQEVARP